MKHRLLAARGAALLVLASAATLAPFATADTPAKRPAIARAKAAQKGAEVAAGEGEARADGDATFHPLAAGDAVPARGELRAGGDGLRVTLASGSTIELARGGEAAIVGEREIALDGYGRLIVTVVDLRRGELSAIVPPPWQWRRPGRGAVLIRGPGHVLAALPGGTLRARVLDRAEGTGLAVAAYDGSARVAPAGFFRQLAAGEIVVLRAGLAAKAIRLAAGPAWAADDGAAGGPLAIVGAADAAAALALRFAAAPGAPGHEVEIAHDAGFRDLVARVSIAPGEAALRTPPLPAGRYFARVRARGAGGLPGAAGPARALRVALASMPQGGEAHAGTFLLPRDRSIKWDDPRGLEVSVGQGGFAPAGPDLGLAQGDQGVAARVRLAGEASFVSIVLAPRAVRAEVELGPKRARWPSDTVTVAVRLVDPGGPPPSFEPRLKLTVNLDEIAVKWQREGDVLRAVVPRAASPGPWVVRAHVSDQRGQELGRASLEVISSSAR